MKELRISNGERLGIWRACRRYAMWVAKVITRCKIRSKGHCLLPKIIYWIQEVVQEDGNESIGKWEVRGWRLEVGSWLCVADTSTSLSVTVDEGLIEG